MIHVNLDEKNAELAERLVKTMPKIVQKAAAAAINRAITSAKAEAAKTIKERYTVKSASVKRAFTVKKSFGEILRAEVIAKGSPLGLASFKFSRPKNSPVRVQVLRRGKLKPVRGLFFNRFRSGYTGPMHRKQKARYPLSSPFGPSLPGMLGNEETLRPAVKRAEKVLNERFIKELDRRISEK